MLPPQKKLPFRQFLWYLQWFGKISEHKLNSIAMVMLMVMQIVLLMAIHP